MSHEPRTLLNQILNSNVSDEDLSDLYDDLKYIFESDFNDAVAEAGNVRGSTYVEAPEQRLN